MAELSDIALEFIKKVEHSKICPYKINGSWWVISGSVCRRCNTSSSKNVDDEAATAEQLWSLFTRMETASYELNTRETAELKDLYDKVHRMDIKDGYTDFTHVDAMDTLERLLKALSDAEIAELIKQYNRLPVLIDYSEGCSYRHRNN